MTSQIPAESSKMASPEGPQETIGTDPISQHGQKVRFIADPIVAVRYYIEDGKLVVTPVLRSEMYIEPSL